jgi:N-methylhydantoinase A/oxoprolinase/acetone carboxylase beta subunit
MKAEFHDIHEREYSRRFEDADVQIANVRVRAVGVMPGLTAPQIAAGSATPPEGSLKLTADAWFRDKGELKKVATAFYERTELLAGNVVEGPAIITQFDSTSVIPPGFTCTVDPVGNLVITYSEAVQQAAERGH